MRLPEIPQSVFLEWQFLEPSAMWPSVVQKDHWTQGPSLLRGSVAPIRSLLWPPFVHLNKMRGHAEYDISKTLPTEA